MGDRVDKLLAGWKVEFPDLNVQSMSILGRIFHITKRIEQELMPLLSSHQLTIPEFDVLAIIRRSGEPYQLRVKALCEQSLLSSGAMTNRIDRLVHKKLIRRSHSKQDRRSVIISLTAKGKKTIDTILPIRLQQADDQLNALSGGEKEQLTNLLAKLLATMSN